MMAKLFREGGDALNEAVLEQSGYDRAELLQLKCGCLVTVRCCLCYGGQAVCWPKHFAEGYWRVYSDTPYAPVKRCKKHRVHDEEMADTVTLVPTEADIAVMRAAGHPRYAKRAEELREAHAVWWRELD